MGFLRGAGGQLIGITRGQRAGNPDLDISYSLEFIGAGDGIRTHDIQLGKLTLYP